jgi:hypothetical protein
MIYQKSTVNSQPSTVNSQLLSIMSNWICCQIGAREHYAIPRALHQRQKLAHLITDAWVTPLSPLQMMRKSGIRDRFHNQLPESKVHAFNTSLLSFELNQKLQRSTQPEMAIQTQYSHRSAQTI